MTNMPMATNPLFSYEGHDIRMIIDTQTGEPWFVAKDVAEVLGYANPSRSVQDHCKYAKLLKTTDSGVLDEIGPRGILIIPESDVYRLIMKSRLPEAEKFEEWVVGTVLPSIRKNGSYGIQQLSRLDIARMLVESEEERLALTAKVQKDAPKVAGFDVFMNCKDTQSFEEVAKTLGMSAQRLTARLRARGYLFKEKYGKRYPNKPIQEYLDAGWFKRVQHPDANTGAIRSRTRVTPKGADEIRTLVEEGEF